MNRAERTRTANTSCLAMLLALGTLPAQDPLRELATAYLAAQTPAQADADALALRLLAAAQGHGRSAAAWLALRACRELIADVREPQRVADAAQALTQRSDLHGLVGAGSLWLQTLAMSRMGQPQRAIELLGSMTNVRRGLVFGPFGDEGDHYLGRVFPPELNLDVAPVRGRYGMVTPRVVDLVVTPNSLHFPLVDPATGHQGCFYFLHQPRVEQPTAAYLELDLSGSLEVFVNGQRVHREDGYARQAGTLGWVPIGLRRGANHVLVKTALNPMDAMSVRYVDGAGRAIKISEPSDPARIEPLAAEPDPTPPGPFVTPLAAADRAARDAKGDDAALYRLFAGLAANMTYYPTLALEHLLAVEAAPPSDVQQRLALARGLGDATLLPEEQRQSRSRKVLDSVAAETKEHAWAIEQRAKNLADEDKYEAAIRMLQAEVDGGRALTSAAVRLHAYYGKLEFRAQAARLRAAWLAKHPENLPLALAEAEARQRDGDTPGAKAVLLAARKSAGCEPQLCARLMNLATETGDLALLRAAHAERFAGEVDQPGAQRALAEALTRMGNTELARAAWQKLAADPRADHEQTARAGRALLAIDAEAAKKVLQSTLAKDPSQHALRKLLGRLAGGSDDYPSLAPFRRDAAALIAEFKPSDSERGAPATMLLDQMLIEVYADGSAVEEVHQVRRINDQSGVEKYQQAEGASRAAEVVVLHTIGKDGKRYVPNRVSGEFAMPRLAPGAFVEERWRRLKDAPGAEPWRSADFHFQSQDEPFRISELVVILPAQHPGSFRMRNFTGAPEVRKLDDGRTAHVFVQRDVPRLTPEKLAPPTEEIVPLVTYGTDRNPLAAARQEQDYFDYRTRTSSLVQAKAAELCQGLESDLAKLRAIHAFVHGEIPSATRGGASDPTAVLLRKQGERFWLAVALLDAAQVPHTRGTCARTIPALQDEAEPLFFGEQTYGLDCVRVSPRDGAPVWLFQDDPRYWPLGRLPAERMGAPAILFEGDELRASHVPHGDPAGETGLAVHGQAKLDGDGTFTLQLDGMLRGHDGFGAADQLRQLDDNTRKMAARQFASQVLKGFTPKSVELLVKETDQPLRLRGEFTKKRALSDAGEAALLELPLERRGWLAMLGDRGERKQPLAVTALLSGSWEVAIDVNETHRLAELPADVTVRHALLDYSQSYRLDAGKLLVRREFLLRPGRLAANQFGEWLNLLRRLDLAEETKLRLLKR